MKNCKPNLNRTSTEAQKRVRRRFAHVVQYARQVLLEPGIQAAYTAKAREGRPPFIVALSDFLNCPVVEEIDAKDYMGNPGNLIRVKAYDGFKVTEVSMTIQSAGGEIIATARNIPGNKGTFWLLASMLNAKRLMHHRLLGVYQPGWILDAKYKKALRQIIDLITPYNILLVFVDAAAEYNLPAYVDDGELQHSGVGMPHLHEKPVEKWIWGDHYRIDKGIIPGNRLPNHGTGKTLPQLKKISPSRRSGGNVTVVVYYKTYPVTAPRP